MRSEPGLKLVCCMLIKQNSLNRQINIPMNLKMGKKFRALGHLLENKYEELSLAAEWLARLNTDREVTNSNPAK